MTSISVGSGRSGGMRSSGVAADVWAHHALTQVVDGEPTPTERRVIDALLRCLGRWGYSKTTIEDIAREAGMSRATAYRQFPGGKSAILAAAVTCEARRLAEELSAVALAAPTLEECLVDVVHRASCLLEEHAPLRYARDHDPVAFEQHLALRNVEVILDAAGALLGPSFERFLAPAEARSVAVWLARIVLTYFKTPSPLVDLTSREDVVRLIGTFVSPGCSPAYEPVIDLPSTTEPSVHLT